MANGFSKFASDHHYASGIVLIAVGLVGVVGSLTGTLAATLAALWAPGTLVQPATGGSQVPASVKAAAAKAGLSSQGVNNLQKFDPSNNPTNTP